MSETILIHEVHDMWPLTLVEIGGMSVHNPFVKVLQIAENSAYKKSDYVVSIPEYAKKYMMKHGLREGRFVHIPNGVVVEDWKNPKELPISLQCSLDVLRSQGKFIVGYFGGHALSNALDVLLDCAKQFYENKNIIFVLVGKGVEKERLKKRVLHEKINNVFFFEAVEKDCIPNLLKMFDCIYMGTKKSTLYRFGLGMNKFYDAMMAGKPVILSTSAPKTIIEKSHCGIVVPSDDANSVKQAVNKLYFMSDSEREKLGRNGKIVVEQSYTYNKLAEKFEEKMGTKKKKNILLINHYAGSPEMGMEFRPYYFAREWVKKGNRVDIIAADYSHLRITNPTIHKDFEEEIIEGIHYHWVHTGTYKGNGVKRALTMFEFVGKLWIHAKIIVKRLKPDVIITSSTYPLDTYAGQRIKRLSRGADKGKMR